MFNLLLSNPLAFLVSAVGLLVAITIHEFAHAWAADKLGDPTPRMQDRLTLNPLAHLDPIGTLMIVFVGFGWGKPVLFDPYNLKDPLRDSMLIALAGPASNIILAIVLSILIRFGGTFLPILDILGPLFFYTIFINVMLAVFNLIPIHPLDGGKILVGILPKEWAAEAQDFLSRYGFIVLIMLILPIGPNGASPVSSLMRPIIDFVINLLLGPVF